MINNKKAAINSNNKDDKCFQYAATIASNYGEIKWNPEKFQILNHPDIKYNWDGIKYPSKIDDWGTFEKKNPKIVYNVLYTKEYSQYSRNMSRNVSSLYSKK